MAQPPETLVDRRTGRSADEFGVETDLSLKEKVDRFEAAEYDLGFAEAALEKGHNKVDIWGDPRMIEEAIVILKASAEYRASTITIEEIQQAQRDGLVSEGLAQAMIDRKSSAEMGIRLDRAMERFEDNTNLPDRSDLDRDSEPER